MARLRSGLAGLLVFSLAGCGGSPSPSGSPAPSVGPCQTTPLLPTAPTVSLSPSPSQAIRWRILPAQSDLDHAFLQDITTFCGSLVAVGFGNAEAAGVIWSSADGEVWRSLAGPTSLDGTLLCGVAVGDPGLVAVGRTADDPVALFSVDGATWSSSRLPGGGRSAESVAWRGGRFIAVGRGTEQMATIAWTSLDGRTWTGLSTTEEGCEDFSGIVAGPDGFVASRSCSGHTAVFASTDGSAWTRTDLPGPADGSGIPGRLRYVSRRFLLVVGASDVWTSTDGQHWIKTTVPGVFSGSVHDVAAIPGGLVAVGSSDGNHTNVVATADSDLTRWTLQPADTAIDGAMADAVLVSPGGEYLVGVGHSVSGGSVFLLADPSALVRP